MAGDKNASRKQSWYNPSSSWSHISLPDPQIPPWAQHDPLFREISALTKKADERETELFQNPGATVSRGSTGSFTGNKDETFDNNYSHSSTHQHQRKRGTKRKRAETVYVPTAPQLLDQRCVLGPLDPLSHDAVFECLRQTTLPPAELGHPPHPIRKQEGL